MARWGHARWDIENQGFNELVHGWYADHVYKHEPNAIEAFLLTAFLAYDLFHAFLTRNLKPPIQRGRTQIFWARQMAAEIYRDPEVLARGPWPIVPSSPCMELSFGSFLAPSDRPSPGR